MSQSIYFNQVHHDHNIIVLQIWTWMHGINTVYQTDYYVSLIEFFPVVCYSGGCWNENSFWKSWIQVRVCIVIVC